MTEAMKYSGLLSLWKYSCNVFCSKWGLLLIVAFLRHLLAILPALAVALLAHKLNAIALALAVVVFVAGNLYFYAGYLTVFLKTCRNERAHIKDLLLMVPSFEFMITLFAVLSAMAVGLVFFVLPGLIMFCRLCFAPLIVLDEKVGVSRALSRSWELTRGLTWKIAITVAVLVLIEALLGVGLLTGSLLTVVITMLYLDRKADTAAYTSVPDWSGLKVVSVLVLSGGMSLVLTGVILICARSFAEARQIPSSAMEPTIKIGERLVLEKSASYGLDSYRRGDIVVFYPPPIELGGHDLSNSALNVLGRLTGLPFLPYEPAYIKRIIAMPGDRVRIKRAAGVFVNDHLLSEPYTKETPMYDLSTIGDIGMRSPDGSFGKAYPDEATAAPIVVPQGQFFVLGDNRNNSEDSHIWGFLDKKRIIGRAWFRFVPTWEFY